MHKFAAARSKTTRTGSGIAMLNRLLRAAPYIVLQLAGDGLFYQLAGHIEYPATPGRIGPDFWPKSHPGAAGWWSAFTKSSRTC